MRNFFKNTFFSLLGKIIGMLCLVTLDAFIARKLDVEKYAEWVFFFSVLTIVFYIGWMGLNASSKVRLAKLGETELGPYICVSLGLRVIISFIISIVLMIIMVVLCPRLGYPNKYPDLKSLFFYSGVLVFFNSITEYFKEILMGLEHFRILFFLTVLEYLGYLLFTIIFLNRFQSIFSITIAYSIAGLIVFVFGILVIGRKYRFHFSKRLHFRDSISFSKSIISYAIPLMLVGIGVVVLIEIDTFMLGIMSTKEEIAFYNIAKSLTSKAAHVNYSIAVGAMTSFAVVSKIDYSNKKKRFNFIGLFNFIITICLSIAMLTLSPVFVNLFYGDRYYSAYKVIRCLVPYYFLFSVSTFYSTFLDFRGKAKIRSIAYISIILIDVLLNYCLIPRYGAIGASIATSVSLFPYTIMTIIVTIIEWKSIKKKGDNENGIPVEK